MAKIKNFKKRNGLSEAQICFFLLGYNWPFMGHSRFPFKSQKERHSLWEKHKIGLIRMCQTCEPRHDFMDPNENQLRPHEWFWHSGEAPELKRSLSGARKVNPNSEDHIYDKEPLWETDYEYLFRLNLLSRDDFEYVQTSQFKQAEDYAIRFRSFINNNSN